MRFLTDVGVGRAAEDGLRADGHDVALMLDIDPRATDEVILEMALEGNRVLISTDLDFGEMAIRRRLPHCGILILRMDDARGDAKAEAVEGAVRMAGERLEGVLSVLQGGRLRTHRPRRSRA